MLIISVQNQLLGMSVAKTHSKVGEW